MTVEPKSFVSLSANYFFKSSSLAMTFIHAAPLTPPDWSGLCSGEPLSHSWVRRYSPAPVPIFFGRGRGLRVGVSLAASFVKLRTSCRRVIFRRGLIFIKSTLSSNSIERQNWLWFFYYFLPLPSGLQHSLKKYMTLSLQNCSFIMQGGLKLYCFSWYWILPGILAVLNY